jgi:hypothetical protein
MDRWREPVDLRWTPLMQLRRDGSHFCAENHCHATTGHIGLRCIALTIASAEMERRNPSYDRVI